MTNCQLAEWLSRGNGQKSTHSGCGAYATHEYIKGIDNDEVGTEFVIRYWGSDEWIEPTLDVYLKDCK